MSLELAWAAGFYDGEGCTSLSGGGYLCVCIGQTDRFVLDRFHAAVGLGNIAGPYEGKRKGWNPQWSYRVVSHDAVKVLEVLRPHLSPVNEVLRPHLSPVKIAQADTAMASARVAHRRGYCRRDLHRMESSNRTSDNRCAACRRESQRQRYHTKNNGRIAP